MSSQALIFFADVILMIHVLFVVFVVGGLIVIYLGLFMQWRWVRNIWFRLAHLAGIGIVVLQSWFGVICPLTTFEMWLREQAGAQTYQGSFIQHWLQTLLYYDAPAWFFVLCYTAFGTLVLASWFVVKPQRFRRMEIKSKNF